MKTSFCYISSWMVKVKHLTTLCCTCDLTCDQASLTFFVAVGSYTWYNYLTICLLLQCSPESGLFSVWSRNRKVLRTEPWLVTFVALWFPVKQFPGAYEFHHDVWWGEWRERVFVSFKCFFRVFFTKLSLMNKENAFIESHAMGEMFWRCYLMGLGKSAKYVLPPFSLIRDFQKQNTRGNVSTDIHAHSYFN